MVSYLHRITRDKENEPQNDLIREFSLQVIHEPIAITANGFFDIDFDLLGSVSAYGKINFNVSVSKILNLNHIFHRWASALSPI